MGLVGDPGLSGLGRVGTVGVCRECHRHLVLIMPLKVAITEEEQTAWLETPDELPDGLGEA